MIYSIYNESSLVDKTYLIESNIFDEIDRWKTSNKIHAIQKFASDSISDEEYEKLKTLIKELKTIEDYNEYKKAFSRFCYFCHIVPRGVIIKKYDLKKGNKTDRNSLYVEYSYNTKKIQLPDDTKLYHMSKVEGIKELMPFFRGKSYYRGKANVNGFLYDKPRIYLTIRRHMPKFLADYKMNEKLNIYLVKDKISNVYVDPLVWGSVYGAVYIETNKSIPVEELTAKKLEKYNKIDKLNKSVKEGAIDFDDFYTFVSENGFIPLNE